MKKISLLVLLLIGIMGYSQEKISPYYKLGKISTDIESLASNVKEALTSAGFNVIGEYHPEGNSNLYVMAYTSDELIDAVSIYADRGLHAATLKVALVQDGDHVKFSMLNPDYQFRAYLYTGFEMKQKALAKVTESAINALKPLGSDFTPFGGEEKTEKLHKYRYKVMMPYFTNPVELNEFESFEEGLATIQKNLEAKLGNTVKVYEIIDAEKKIAVFGVGLMDQEKGEAKFLPIIGEDHIAAMPYDIILQGNTASMLHGKYRFALYWPELKMGTFMKIMSTPKNVEKFMKALTE